MKTIIAVLAIFLSLLTAVQSLPEYKHSCHQRLVLVGGGSVPQSVKSQFITLAGGKDAHLLIIPSASCDPESPAFVSAWDQEDIASIEVLHAKSRSEAIQYEFYSRIRRATGVWISGGDQARLVELYRGTPVIMELKHLLMRGGVVGGTSAGASIAGDVMPYGDEEMFGFGLLEKTIIDQHFSNRHREERLKRLVDKHPGMLGVGIDEGTAIIVDDGKITVVGDGGVKFMGNS